MKDNKMSIHSQFATDTKKETEGVEIPYPDAANSDGSIPTFVIARAGKSNKKYSRMLERATKPHRHAMKTGTISNETSEKLMMDVFVDTLLLDWKHVQDRNGKTIVYNRENAIALMKELPDLYADLTNQTQQIELFREEEKEEEAKN